MKIILKNGGADQGAEVQGRRNVLSQCVCEEERCNLSELFKQPSERLGSKGADRKQVNTLQARTRQSCLDQNIGIKLSAVI